MIHEADLWTDDEIYAQSQMGHPLGEDHVDLVCVSVHREQGPDVAQAPPPPKPHPKNPSMLQEQPAPPPLPGKVRWRLHYEAK